MTQLRLPLRRVTLPKRAELAPYLDRIDANGMYTNYGPMAAEFETRLADHFECAAGNVVVLGNATIALTLVLDHLGVRRGAKCLVPSLTFLASPAAALAAGLEPFFMDVDKDRWASSPAQAAKALEAAGGSASVGAVMPVSTYGNPLDLAEWQDFQDRTGVAVVIDGAWCFDSARLGPALQCISLHATKVFGTGEGGVVLGSPPDTISALRRRANFGILPDRRVLVPGINAKMSEYHAAIGLAGLDTWAARRASTIELQAWYQEAIAAQPALSVMPGFGTSWAGGTVAVALPSPAPDLAAKLAARGIEARHWWGRPCHLQPAYAAYGRADLTATMWLSERILNLPFWVGMSRRDVVDVVDAVAAG